MRSSTRHGGEMHKWMEFGLLLASSGAILAVVTWVESGLAG